MDQVKLGSQGLVVSAEGLGCMGMSAFYGPSDEAENLSTLARAIELGITFFDTAEIYGPFKNEILLSQAFKGKRDKVLIATKVGSEVSDDGQRGQVNGTPAYINKAIERSLRHLGMDYVDLYYLHRIDPKVEIEESIGALKELVEEGKVRYIGVSEAKAETIRRGHKVHPITAVQTEYSLFSREPEENLLPVLRELDIALVAYSPLGRGFSAAVSAMSMIWHPVIGGATTHDSRMRRSQPISHWRIVLRNLPGRKDARLRRLRSHGSSAGIAT